MVAKLDLTSLGKGLLGLALGLTVLTGCNTNNEPEELAVSKTKETLNLTVSILPQEYFVKKIAQDKVEVNVLVQPGSEPETYEPLPQQLKTISESRAYIILGVSLERGWLIKIQSVNPNLVIIDSGEGISLIPNGEEREDNLDPHIWLSPKLVKIQAQNIYQGLVSLDPENKAEYKQNLDDFMVEIDQLDAQIRQNLTGIENRKFIVFHPAWGYFAQDYDLEQIPIEIGGKEPSPGELGELVKLAQTKNIKVIFAQYQFNARTAETIAKEIGGEVQFIDPIAPNWSENLLKVSETLSKVFKGT